MAWQPSQYSQCGDINNSSAYRWRKALITRYREQKSLGWWILQPLCWRWNRVGGNRRSLNRPTFLLNVNVGRSKSVFFHTYFLSNSKSCYVHCIFMGNHEILYLFWLKMVHYDWVHIRSCTSSLLKPFIMQALLNVLFSSRSNTHTLTRSPQNMPAQPSVICGLGTSDQLQQGH